MDYSEAPYYRVALLGGDRRTPLPSSANQWTGIACVLWDDAMPTVLDPAQQQAMLDWLHWGGQLILSGPDTLDSLRSSFLAPYLPAMSDGPCKLDGSSLAALNTFSDKISRQLAPARPWSGVRLKKHPQAEFVPGAGQLLIERRVGRGRVVVSAFRLSNHEFTDWPGCDGVFNAMLLRRPPREYVENSDATVRLDWADHGSRLDAARVTQLRYFARDTGVPFASYASDVRGRNVDVDESNANAPMAIDLPTPAPGIAAWNDFNPVAQAARQSLQSAARIEIPKSSFVLWVVAVYLVVLVPVNWAVFRSLRRVEWAWVAAPVIAIACTITVIRLAQLDIGFARSQTEVAVAEMQGDYPRAHVARYDALYTSLATSYTISRATIPARPCCPFPPSMTPTGSACRSASRCASSRAAAASN